MKKLKCVTWRGYESPLIFGNYPQRHNLDIDFTFAPNDDQTLDVARNGGIDLIGGPEVEWTNAYGCRRTLPAD
jgi:hypothetical protein